MRDRAVTVDWNDAEATDIPAADLDAAPLRGAGFAPLPKAATSPKQYDTWKRALAASLYATQTLDLLVHAGSGLHQRPGETEGAFRVRVQEQQHEARDADVEKLRTRYASRIATQQDRVRRAAQAIEREQGEVTQTGLHTVVTTITGLAGALFGRKRGSATNVGRLGTAARGAGRTVKAQQDVARARDTHAAEQAKLAGLEAELEEALRAVQARYADLGALTTVGLRPRKSDITVDVLTLAWVPQVQ